MRFFIFLLLLGLTACHAHERALISAGAKCPDIALTADDQGQALPAPHIVSGGEAAAGSAMVGLGSLANLFGATAPVTLITPAGTVQTETAGWRQYEGCSVAAVCFDSGYCSPVEGQKLVPLVHLVPSLMRRSEAEQGKHFPGCSHRPIAGRRGPLVWSLHACGQSVACFVNSDRGYDCLGADGQKRDVGTGPVISQ
ncbi:MAG: hypothetical protein QM723_27665 [Myxococcaceae bacterium]